MRISESALYHHGILGQKWGKRNGPPYPLDSGDHSVSEKKAGWRKSLDKDGSIAKSAKGKARNRVDKSPAKRYSKNKSKDFRLSDGQKRAIKTGVIATVAVLAAYGAYKAGYLDDVQSVGAKAVTDILREFGSAPVGDFKGFTPPSSPKPDSSKRKPVIRDPKTGFKLVKETTEESLKNANPLKGKGGENNCTYCAVAGFLRTQGYDVTAKSTGGKAQNLGGVLENCFKGVKVYEGSATKFAKSPEDAAQMLKKRFGNNASGAVGIDWKSGNEGHAFSWAIKDGTVRFLDFQNNNDDSSVRRVLWPMIDPTGNLTFARLDGLEINLDTIDKYVNGR